MSESQPLVAPQVLDELAAAVQRGEPRAFELAYGLSRSLPREGDHSAAGLTPRTFGEADAEGIAEQVRQLIDDAAKKYGALSRGEFAAVDLSNPNVLAYELKWQDERLLILNNLARVSQPVKFHSYTAHEGWDILNRVEFTFPARAQLEPYEFLWLALEPEKPST